MALASRCAAPGRRSSSRLAVKLVVLMTAPRCRAICSAAEPTEPAPPKIGTSRPWARVWAGPRGARFQADHSGSRARLAPGRIGCFGGSAQNR